MSCRRILTEKHGYRIAVIMNEFGDTAVCIVLRIQKACLPMAGHRRSALTSFIETRDGETAFVLAKTINVSSADDPAAEQTEEFLELANGCLCCSIKDTGVAAIERLMLKKGAFDYILLETTGLADPGLRSTCLEAL